MSIYIHKTAEVSDKAIIGDGTKIWNGVQIREGAMIGKNCIIGKDSYIDVNVKIGNNVKLQNFVSVYDGVIIEDDVFIGPSVTFTNDMYPRAKSTSRKWIKTIVEKGVSIGANSTIICGIILHKNCMIGAGSVVTKSIPLNALAYGNAAIVKRKI